MTVYSSEIDNSINVTNKFAVFSNFEDDVIFNKEKFDGVISCAGYIEKVGKDVYNLKKGDFVGYLALDHMKNLLLSSNLVVSIRDNSDFHLIAILPYAVLAMNILRRINPVIGHKIILVGKNFFIHLLQRLISLSGAEVFLISAENPEREYPSKVDCIIYVDPLLRDSIKDKIKTKSEKEYSINEFKLLDFGLDDQLYYKGVKYPYSYIRWHYQNNLKYFIHNVDTGIIDLDFFDIKVIKLVEIEQISQIKTNLSKNSLVLFQLE